MSEHGPEPEGTDDDEADVSQSVTVSLLLSAVATALIYVELWGGTVPGFDATGLALGVGGGLVAGGLFYLRGTRSTPLNDIPPLAIFLAIGLVVYVFFPDGLPAPAELALIVGLWTDTAGRGARAA